jgi:hypothetical protein
MGGLAYEIPVEGSNGPRVTRLTAEAVKLLTEKDPRSIPDISLSIILDKSKANSFAKFIVCAQALWFCAQCIFRLAVGLSASLLELNTLGHCVCALFTYQLWWSKPLDVEEPFMLPEEPELLKEERLANERKQNTVKTNVQKAEEEEAGKNYHNLVRDKMENFSFFNFQLWTFLAVTSLLYGGLHLVAWNAPFQTRTHKLLWRISAICIAGFGPGILVLLLVAVLVGGALLLLYDSWLESSEFSCTSAPLHIIYWVSVAGATVIGIVILIAGALLYAGARIYIVVECFLSLPYLPDIVFQQPQWQRYFPHIS